MQSSMFLLFIYECLVYAELHVHILYLWAIGYAD